MSKIVSQAISRRTALTVGTAAAVPAAVAAMGAPDATADPHRRRSRRAGMAVKELEARYDVHIGLAAKNLRTGRNLSHRQSQRFPLCSTFKVIAAASLLRHGAALDHIIDYPKSTVVEHSPITAHRHKMSIAQIIDAALRYSDNTAGNLMLHEIGGPPGVTRFARSIGDQNTRLDRWETELNTAYPGDHRDTTTPASIAETYRKILLDDILPPDRRWFLRSIMQRNTTSEGKFRAGLPDSWWLTDKTGGGRYGTGNDIGLISAPDGQQITVAALTRSSRADATADPALMTDLAELVIRQLQ